MFNHLHDRTLWFDGVSSYSSNQLVEEMYNNPNLLDCCFITSTDNAIKQYEIESDTTLPIKDSITTLDINLTSTIPTDFDIVDYVNDKFLISLKDGMSEDEVIKRYERIEYELMCFIKINKLNYLYTIIHIISKMKESKTCWNSRGSSSASYLLYVLGVHYIDSYHYNLDPKEFFKVEL